MPRTVSFPQSNPTNPQVFPVPYPASLGATIAVISVSNFMAVGSQSNQGPAPGQHSDAYIEILNCSDVALVPLWDSTGAADPPIPIGWAWSVPIPRSATELTLTALIQNPNAYFPVESLICTLYQASDIRAGHIPRTGALPPSVPAASIGPGPLPVGVTLAGNQLTGTVVGQPATNLACFRATIAASVSDQIWMDIDDLSASSIRWQLYKASHTHGDNLYFYDFTNGKTCFAIQENDLGVQADSYRGLNSGNVTVGGTGSTLSALVKTSNAGQVEFDTQDDGAGHASGLTFVLACLDGSGVLHAGLKVQGATTAAESGIVQKGIYSTSGSNVLLVQEFTGTTDPSTVAGITVNPGDTWTNVAV